MACRALAPSCSRSCRWVTPEAAADGEAGLATSPVLSEQLVEAPALLPGGGLGHVPHLGCHQLWHLQPLPVTQLEITLPLVYPLWGRLLPEVGWGFCQLQALCLLAM